MPVKLSDLADKVLIQAARRTTGLRRMRRILNSISKAQTRQNSAEELDTKVRLKQFMERESRMEELNPRKHASRSRKSAPGLVESVVSTPITKSDLALIGLERKLTGLNNLLSIEFLEEGREAARAVVRISTPLSVGTGFFVSPNVIITNHHVISSAKVAERSEFDVFAEETTVDPNFQEATLYFSPSTFFFTDKDLDLTLVAVEEETKCSKCGWLPLIGELGKILIGHPVNVIQHPDGDDKKIVAHNSLLLDLEDKGSVNKFCWYSADTEEGSSGAPVFNNRWEVIALHHKSVPATNKNGEILDVNGKVMSRERLKSNPEMVKWIANEGVRISKIVGSVENANLKTQAESDLRDKIVSQWKNPRSFRQGLKQGWFT